MFRLRILFTTVFFLILSSVCSAQSISELQKMKQKAANEIEYTTRLLKETQENERSSLSSLRLLNNKINQRNTIISSINGEVKLYQQFIDDNLEVLKMLQTDVKEIKTEYAELIRSAYRHRNANDNILFLLSADNVNQAYRRFLYLKRYTAYRQNQAKTIAEIQMVLNEKTEKLKQLKETKQKLIEETKKETQQLIVEKQQQSSAYRKLQNKQRELRQKLNKQQRIENRLEREIQKIIEEEARKSRAAGGGGFVLTPEQKLIGNSFAQNKQRLPWPVERGIIIEHFGIHQHPVLTNVQIKNNGINIATEIGSNVRTVFNGEVSRVFGISGGNSAVIIRHGKYLSVYSNLSEVVVKKGDKVKTKQIIGKVYFDKDDVNKSILKFQIWHENQKLNPEEWIVK